MAYKIKYKGKHGTGNVYQTNKGHLFAIHHYGNLSEIVPVEKKKSGFWITDESKLKQVKRFPDESLKSQDKYIKKLIENK